MIFAIKKAKNVTFIQKDLSHLKYLVRTILLLRLKKCLSAKIHFTKTAILEKQW